MKEKLNDNLKSGLMYFYIHFVTEIICFFALERYIGDRPLIWIIFLSYDMFAFVPQAIIGRFSDRYPKIPLGTAGMVLLGVAAAAFDHIKNPFVSLAILCLGNCLVHVNGAEATLRTADGKLSGSAIFVSGGSFGVVTGRILGKTSMSFRLLIILAATALPLTILTRKYIHEESKLFSEQCKPFRYAKSGVGKELVIIMSVTIVAVRGFMGYGIPTSWNKTVMQTVLLFSFMGIGKALGGIFADRFGFRKTAMLSTAFAAPLLMAGDHHMTISLLGVMLFSMTMAITLGILVSVLTETPGLAFGLTTIGLFIGTAPVFFFKFITLKANCIMIAGLSIICLVFMWIIIRKDEADE